MDFKTRRIRKEPRIKPQKKTIINSLPSFHKPLSTETKPEGISPHKRPKLKKIHISAMTTGIILIIALFFGIYTVVRSLDFSSIIFSFGQPLITDEKDKTNILLIGVGTQEHDGADLTDTIIVASIDHRKKIVPMVSIPRDLYIEKEPYSQTRINAVYHAGKTAGGEAEGIEALKEKVTAITGMDIQYYVKVDFNGFVNIVDSLGGVDLLVEEAINDPYYPKEGTIEYETFRIEAGMQHLNGETALKYARSRKTTSDFDRAKRQQALLYAIRDKALSLNILTDAGKIGDLYDSVGQSLQTNLTLPEIIEMGKFAKNIQREDLFPIVMNDDPTACGGLVYTPAREYFSGASVLLPVGDGFDYTRFFITNVLSNIESIANRDEIQVLNGTKVPGLAYQGMNILSRFCMNVTYYSNASDRSLAESTIYYRPDEEGNPPAVLDIITTVIPVKTQAGIPPEYLTDDERRSNSAIVVELGQDYLSKRIPDPFNSLRLFTPPETQESQTDSGTEEEPVTESAEETPSE